MEPTTKTGAIDPGGASPDQGSSPQFAQSRPSDIHTASTAHRYRHYIRTLPKTLESLATELHLGPGDRILDYGCADVPYREFFPHDADYVGADLPGNARATVTINPDGTLPVEQGSFDAVVSTQVLEHVQDPPLYLAECFRVLRPGGRLMLSTHGIFVYHPDPVDFWRWTSAGLERVLSDAGFEVKELEGVVGLIAIGLQLVQDATYYKVPAGLRQVLAFTLQRIIALADRLQSPESKRLNASVYVIVAEKP
ncbi:MAG: hypothetical protein QOI00_1459 [Chloroflexota bacterium]|nr:hypothetical protein [Chloroflexota bacterium]